MEWQPIETAPKDRGIAVLSRWAWDGFGAGDAVFWQVAQWDDHMNVAGYWTVTDNPYSDLAIDPIGWIPLPPNDTMSEGR